MLHSELSISSSCNQRLPEDVTSIFRNAPGTSRLGYFNDISFIPVIIMDSRFLAQIFA